MIKIKFVSKETDIEIKNTDDLFIDDNGDVFNRYRVAGETFMLSQRDVKVLLVKQTVSEEIIGELQYELI